MQIRTLTLFVWLMSFVIGPVQAHQETPDPLIILSEQIITAAFKEKDGIDRFIRPDPPTEDESPRVAAIKKFGRGFWYITEQRAARPGNVWSTIQSSDFRLERVIGPDGAPTDSVLVILKAPGTATFTKLDDGRRYGTVRWTIEYTRSGKAVLIESVTQEFVDPRPNGRGLLLSTVRLR